MRKFLKIMIPLLCFMPLFISAGTFEDGRKLANKYMQENFEDDYSRYIVSEDTKYGFSEKGIFSVSGFNKGGLINKYEYDLSKDTGSTNDSSWLYDVNGYWSLTGDNNNAYVIGKTTYPKANVFNNRLVEYVRNTTKVSGKGTYSNPWVINKTYQVVIKANKENLVNSIYHNNNKCGEDRCETNITMSKDAIFYINFKEGYEYDTSEGGANLCNASSYTASSGKLVIPNVMDDVECFFKVKEKEYKITFDANGGILPGKNSKNVAYTKSYGILPEPTREGYGFAGWYTEKDGGDRIDSSSILDTPEAKTLYAHWDVKSYTVTFDGNGGTPSYSNKTVVYDSNYESLPTANRTGYTFTGWYTAASGGTQVTSTTKVTITSNQILYAQWNANTFTVTFVGNGGTMGSTTKKTVTYDSAYGDLSKITATRTGYTFTGWYTAASGGTQVTSETTVTITSNQTLYAQWNANTYTATFVGNGGTMGSTTTKPVTYNSTYGDLSKITATRIGYTFKGWYTAASGGTQVTSTTKVTQAKDHTIYAQWNANTYTATFVGNGGTMGSTTTKPVTYNSTYGDLSKITATRIGYTFKGWYTAASGGTQVTSTTKVTQAKDHTIYAQWNANTYTVTFNQSGGTTPNPPSKPVTYDSTYGTLATTSRVGYTLKGWYTSALNGTQVTSTSKVTITSNQTLYAQWNANKYTVKFNANGGTQPAAQTVTYNSTYGTLPTTTRSGYVFTGWYTSNTGGTRVYNTTKVTITSTQTLYARWEANAPTDLPKTYVKTEAAQTYDVKVTGIYKLEVWGAQGGDIYQWAYPLPDEYYNPLNYGGYGAYATGQIKLTAGTKLYIYVGGKGGTGGRTSPSGAGLPPITTPGTGGYNGGGSGGYGSSSSYPYDDSYLKYAGGSGGGGATHIATTSGLLSTLSNKKSNILIVAGGGGGVQGSGSCDSVRPNAGGASGIGNISTGATQTSGYSFGQGQAGRSSYTYYNCGAEGGGGGGGGYYGGYAYQGTGEFTSANGGGGSSYIGNTNLTNKAMYCYNCTSSSSTNTKTNKITSVSTTPNAYSAKMGDGAARITWVGAE